MPLLLIIFNVILISIFIWEIDSNICNEVEFYPYYM